MALGIVLEVRRVAKWQSIRMKLAGGTFLILALTVCSLIVLMNWQMEKSFRDYLLYYFAAAPSQGGAEMMFLQSVHQSLWWVGAFFIAGGLVASYLMATSITKPLRRLTNAAKEIGRGNFDQQIPAAANDEVGQLTRVFNQMATDLSCTEQSRRRFFANVAHELRTPLAILQGNLENISSGVTKPEPEIIISMHEEVMRLSRLVTDLRDLSLAEVSELKLHRKPTDLGQMAMQLGQFMQPLFDEAGQELTLQLPKDLPLAFVDPDRIRQVLGNLLINASRYSGQGAHIGLRVCAKGQRICIEVCDDGPGIPAADLPHIFEQFYRGEKSRNRENGGSGIGLALARRYVEIHGGSIAAKNQPQGGACFVIKLPQAEN